MGNDVCCWTKEKVLWVVDQVIGSLVREGSKPFYVGNGCPITGRCPSNQAHGNLEEIDFDYPTYSGLPTTPWSKERRERIWIEPWVLDEPKIDWRTIWRFLTRLQEFCSYDGRVRQFIIHEKVFDLICKNISRNERASFYSIVTQDTGHNENHHLHMHLKIGLRS